VKGEFEEKGPLLGNGNPLYQRASRVNHAVLKGTLRQATPLFKTKRGGVRDAEKRRPYRPRAEGASIPAAPPKSTEKKDCVPALSESRELNGTSRRKKFDKNPFYAFASA